MELVHPRCAGIDVHRRSVSVCTLVNATDDPTAPPTKTIRHVGTMTDDLLTLGDWLREQGVTHIAMESTGVYWKPVWNLLESQFDLLLVNAQHLKRVPGRKSDVKDCEWLAELLRFGLLTPSYVPDRAQRELRELLRYRATLVVERAAEANRIQQTLEGANLKLGLVATDVLGVSGRAIVKALTQGTDAGAELAQLAQGRLRQKLPELTRALTGRVGPHQRFLLAQQLAHVDDLDEAIAQLDAEVKQRLAPFEPTIQRLRSVPGIGRRVAEVVLAEVGTDVRQFPSAQHLASWAGLCPGNTQSAAKRGSGKTRKGNHALRRVLIEAALAASRTKATALRSRYDRLAARRGGKKAIVALAHLLLRLIYHLLSEPEAVYDDQRAQISLEQQQRHAERLVKRLERLGYTVTLDTAA
jgi:transposase